jgi:hypothetical protein
MLLRTPSEKAGPAVQTREVSPVLSGCEEQFTRREQLLFTVPRLSTERSGAIGFIANAVLHWRICGGRR